MMRNKMKTKSQLIKEYVKTEIKKQLNESLTPDKKVEILMSLHNIIIDEKGPTRGYRSIIIRRERP